MKRLAFLALALLAGCDQQPASDGYTFGPKEFTHPDPAIHFVIHKSIEDLRAAAPYDVNADARAQGRVLMAFSVMHPGGIGTCTVHIVDPAVSYQPEWIGHEVAHCIWGRWHP